MRTCCLAQGTLLNALWITKWEENPRNGKKIPKMGRKSKKEGIYICIADSLCHSAETL